MCASSANTDDLGSNVDDPCAHHIIYRKACTAWRVDALLFFYVFPLIWVRVFVMYNPNNQAKGMCEQDRRGWILSVYKETERERESQKGHTEIENLNLNIQSEWQRQTEATIWEPKEARILCIYGNFLHTADTLEPHSLLLFDNESYMWHLMCVSVHAQSICSAMSCVLFVHKISVCFYITEYICVMACRSHIQPSQYRLIAGCISLGFNVMRPIVIIDSLHHNWYVSLSLRTHYSTVGRICFSHSRNEKRKNIVELMNWFNRIEFLAFTLSDVFDCVDSNQEHKLIIIF